MIEKDIPLLQQKMTRREALGFALATPLLVGGTVTYEATRQEYFRRWNERFYGFSPVSEEELMSLYEEYSEDTISQVPLREHKEDNVVFHTSFRLENESPVHMYVQGEEFDTTFIQPLIAQVDGGRKLLVPVVHGQGNLPISSIQIPRLPEGEHELIFLESSATNFPNTKPLQIELAIPKEGSVLAEMMHSSPMVAVKNPDNLLDDTPLTTYSQLMKNGETYQSRMVMLMSSENKGLMPDGLMRNFGRTLDVEWLTEQLHRSDGKVREDSLRYQGIDHRLKRFAGDFYKDRPMLRVATGNNTFDDDLSPTLFGQTIPFLEPDENHIFYAPLPMFYPPGISSRHLIEQYPHYQEWSNIELLMEGCIRQDDPHLEGLYKSYDRIKPFIKGDFRNRGCKTLLSSADIYSD